jgi:hypothetical protein
LSAASLAVPTAPIDAVQAGSCTGWRSRTVPPRTIRVLRTSTGTVQRVDFRRYVGEVMASGEWPTWMPRSALAVGAVAVKQYAWYYALKGHHRDWYRTRSGACYDVRDDVADQLFRPGRSGPTRKQLQAIESTWQLTLRKRGRFFLTGYRAGNRVRCARDADGWHLFQASVQDCARRGWSRHRIQLAYYSPAVTFMWRADPAPTEPDTEAPTVTAPRIALVRGSTVGKGRGIGAVAWIGADAGGSGIGRYRLQRRTDDSPWETVQLDHARATRDRLMIGPGTVHQFRVQPVDRAGNVGAWSVSPAATRHIISADTLHPGEGWSVATRPTALGGTTVRATTPRASLRLVFDGRAVAVIAPRGPRLGRIRIIVDGEPVETVSLRDDASSSRRLVWTRTWREAGRHVVKVVALGNGHPSRPFDGARVEVDAFAVVE